jgi:hypothetical protein
MELAAALDVIGGTHGYASPLRRPPTAQRRQSWRGRGSPRRSVGTHPRRLVVGASNHAAVIGTAREGDGWCELAIPIREMSNF